MTTEHRWDVGDEVVIKKSGAPPMRGKNVASSAIRVVFGVMTVISSIGSANQTMAFTSSPKTIVERVQLARADRLRAKSLQRVPARDVDAQIGLSTGKLADLFPRLFEPVAEEEADGEPFHLS